MWAAMPARGRVFSTPTKRVPDPCTCEMPRCRAVLSFTSSGPMSAASCPFRKLYPDVVVVQPRQDWDGYNDTGPLDCPTQGRVFRSPAVEDPHFARVQPAAPKAS